MKQFPQSWVLTELGALAEFEMGQAPPGTSCNFDSIGTPFVKAGEFGAIRPIIREWTTEPKKFATKNDVLICVVGATAGKINYGEDCSIGRSVAAIRPNGGLLQPILYAQLLSQVQKLRAGTTGSAQGVISKEALSKIQIALAPLPEQKRIADKLDATLARVDVCRERLARVAPILKRFRQSVLAAATSGQLTADWREQQGYGHAGDDDKALQGNNHANTVGWADEGSPTLAAHDERWVSQAQPSLRTGQSNSGVSILKTPLVIFQTDQEKLVEGWRWEKLVTLAKLESGHTPRKSVPEYWENGTVPWISLQDIRAADGREITATKYMPTILGIENSSARLLPKGTVCFCRDISFGYVTMMGREMATTQHFANWVCHDGLVPKYLMYAFMAGRDFLGMSSGQGTTVTTIYMPALKELRLATPPVAEQTEIVRRVETLFAFADRLEARLASASAAAERLTPSLLAKAFRGELVPQDPNDEPASELLKRLAASRESAATAPKAKRGRKPAAA